MYSVNVFRWSLGDSTNGGVSAKQDSFTVVETDAKANELLTKVDPTKNPILVLRKGQFNTANLSPPKSQWPQGEVGPMFGGNYAAGDSSFNDAVRKMLGNDFYGAVAIHDRFESQELNDQLSR